MEIFPVLPLACQSHVAVFLIWYAIRMEVFGCQLAYQTCLP